MLMKPRLFLVALALACGACSKQAVVDLTIDVDPAVPAAVVAAVRSLRFDVGGLFTQSSTVALTQPFASHGQERLAVRAATGGDVTLDVSALDDAGAALLVGETQFTLRVGVTGAQAVTLYASDSSPDGGAPPDLGGAPDLATSPPGDLAVADMAPVVCPTNVLLCEDFESGAISPTKWDNGTTQKNGTVTVDNTRAHRGQYSLHLHSNIVASSGSAEATIAETHTFTPPGATFWARAFYYFPSNTSSVAGTLFDATQNASPYNDVTLSLDHDALAIYNALNGGSYVASTTPLLPLDQWVCIEWEVYTGSPNQLHAWVNGQAVTMLDLTQTTNPSTPIGIFSVGFAIYPPDTSPIALDLWVDDIIFDHAPIGCAK